MSQISLCADVLEGVDPFNVYLQVFCIVMLWVIDSFVFELHFVMLWVFNFCSAQSDAVGLLFLQYRVWYLGHVFLYCAVRCCRSLSELQCDVVGHLFPCCTNLESDVVGLLFLCYAVWCCASSVPALWSVVLWVFYFYATQSNVACILFLWCAVQYCRFSISRLWSLMLQVFISLFYFSFFILSFVYFFIVHFCIAAFLHQEDFEVWAVAGMCIRASCSRNSKGFAWTKIIFIWL